MKYVVYFDDPTALDSNAVGQKFSVLAKAHRNGFPVPHAFCITTGAHQFFVEHGRWPEGLRREVCRNAERLGLDMGLSIRSSATREDLENQSFAGQYSSYLGVIKKQELDEKIEQCWFSAGSDHVRRYQKYTSGTSVASTPPMGVIIQRMVRPLVSGVAFGRNPMRPGRKEVLIEAVRGLADALVSGHVTPYRAVVAADESISLTPPSGTTRQLSCNSHRLLTVEQWREIADMTRSLERMNDETPQDIEWAVDADKTIWLLQARAITTQPAKRVCESTGTWTRKIANDLWADRLSPFLADHMEQSAPVWNLSAVSRWIGLPVVEPAVKVINGYLFLNCASILAAIGALPVALRFNFLSNLLPPEAPISGLPAPSKPQTAVRLMRMSALPLWKPECIPHLCAWLTRRHIIATQTRLDAMGTMPDGTAADAYRKLEAVRSELTRIQIKNQFPYFYATALTWLLRWLLTERFHLTHADFLIIVGRGGSNISLKIEKHFRAIAQKINSLPSVAADIRRQPAAEMQNRLPPRLVADIRDLIRLYGCRSRHRSLYVKRWAEDPDEVLSIIHRLVLHGVPLEPADSRWRHCPSGWRPRNHPH